MSRFRLRRGRKSAPGYVEQCRQLTAARAEHSWLAKGSQVVQQQALRDFAAATAAFYDPNNPARRPAWRRAGRNEGFRIVGKRGRQWDVRRVSRRVGQVRVPKAGWVRFRWSRAVPAGVKSYRVTCRTRRPAGWKASDPRSPASAARRAGTWTRSRARAKPPSGAPPADTLATLMLNAAINIVAGYAATARGGDGTARPVNREPHLLVSSTGHR